MENNEVCIAGHSKNHHQVKQYCLRLMCCMMKPWRQICFYMLLCTVNVHPTHFSSLCQLSSSLTTATRLLGSKLKYDTIGLYFIVFSSLVSIVQ